MLSSCFNANYGDMVMKAIIRANVVAEVTMPKRGNVLRANSLFVFPLTGLHTLLLGLMNWLHMNMNFYLPTIRSFFQLIFLENLSKNTKAELDSQPKAKYFLKQFTNIRQKPNMKQRNSQSLHSQVKKEIWTL